MNTKSPRRLPAAAAAILFGVCERAMQNLSALTTGRKRISRAGLRDLVIISAALVWILGLAFGIRKLHAFESTPGEVGLTPSQWPAATALALDPAEPTLVMFIHPQCSCTRASLSELRELVGAVGRSIKTRIVFVQPEGQPESATWHDAVSIYGAAVSADPKGQEAVRFGALTSGYIVAYDTAGALLFSGGITAARGHSGENMGRLQLIKALNQKWSEIARHPVFGCPLEAEVDAATMKEKAPV